MTPPWLYSATVQRGSVPLDESEARHATSSLRLGDGDEIVLFNGLGTLGRGRLASRAAGRRVAWSAEIEQVEQIARPDERLTLFVSAPKGERLDWLVEKCTELNASALVLVNCERAVRRLEPSHTSKLQRIAIEAAKQCGRPWLPVIQAGAPLLTAVEAWRQASAATRLALADPHASQPMSAWMRINLTARLGVLIGPEGGWSDEERDTFFAQGAEPVRLGDTILRIETAAIAIAALCEGLRDG